MLVSWAMEWQRASFACDQSVTWPHSACVLFPVPSCNWSEDEQIRASLEGGVFQHSPQILIWDLPEGVGFLHAGGRGSASEILRERLSRVTSWSWFCVCREPPGALSINSPLPRVFSSLSLWLSPVFTEGAGWRAQTLSYTFAFRKTTGHKIL